MTDSTTANETDTDTRHMLVVSEVHKGKLKKLSKHFRLTQGEIVGVLLDKLDLSRMTPHFEELRNGKVDSRTSKTAMLTRLKDLSQEQLAAIERLIAEQKI
jgi:hypothetical protein